MMRNFSLFQILMCLRFIFKEVVEWKLLVNLGCLLLLYHFIVIFIDFLGEDTMSLTLCLHDTAVIVNEFNGSFFADCLSAVFPLPRVQIYKLNLLMLMNAESPSY